MIAAVKNYLEDQMSGLGLDKVYFEPAEKDAHQIMPWAAILTPRAGPALRADRVDQPLNQAFFDEDHGGEDATPEEIALRDSYRRIVKVFDTTLNLDVTFADRTSAGLDSIVNSFLANLHRRIVIDTDQARGYTTIDTESEVDLNPLNALAEITVGNVIYNDRVAHNRYDYRAQIRVTVKSAILRADRIEAITSVKFSTSIIIQGEESEDVETEE